VYFVQKVVGVFVGFSCRFIGIGFAL
jgi:hypothetical protein